MGATDDQGATPLHCAALRGHKQMIIFLLDKGADVNASPAGVNPLGLAKDPEVCALLRKRGAR
jgi:ankyrin repeat protein